MMIGIQGTSNFNDYAVFLGAMGVALRRLPDEDKTITVFSAGPLNVNRFAAEFLNVSENGLKARGIKAKLVKVPPSWFEKNIHTIDHFAYFAKYKEPLSSITTLADAKNVDVQVYRF